MICNKCEVKNNNGANYCENCGSKLHSVEIKNERVELWNPNVAFVLGFLLTFLFTSRIIEENWKILGFQKKLFAINLMTVIVFLFFLYVLHNRINSENSFLISFEVFYPTVLGVNILFMIFIYFISAKTQIEFIAFNYKNYKKKSFIGSSILAIIAIISAYMMIKQPFS